MRYALIITIVLTSFFKLCSQNLENIDTKNPLQLSGNISVGSSFYKSIGIENRRSPFAYYISASPTISIYGFDIPLSFVYRDQQGSISTPFNRFSINPSYKWAKLYLGNNNISLSKYTLSGQYLNGVGVELTPGIFHLTAAYGNLENPLLQIDTLVEGAILIPTYKRKAYAMKIGVGNRYSFIHLIGLKAKDDVSSIENVRVNNRNITPEENLVMGTEASIRLFKRLTFKLNAAASAYTGNQTSDVNIAGLDPNFARANDILTLNLSTRLQFAGDASINFKIKNFNIGAEYKRVDPLYKSLGTLYFQEDYENYTGKLGFSLFKRKLSFRGSGGIQRNNLNNLRSYTRTRTIANFTLSISPSRAFTTVLRFSNFQSDRSPGLINVNDTLRYAQTTAMYGIMPRISFGSKDRRSTISMGANYQQLLDLSTSENAILAIDNYTGNATYSLQLKPKNLSFDVSGLYNLNLIEGRETQRTGGSLGLRKTFFNRALSFRSSLGFYQNQLNKTSDGFTATARAGITFKQKGNYNLGFNLNYLFRDASTRTYQEIRSNIQFTYLFSTKKKTN